MYVIVSDFDNTLFRRNHGLIVPVVNHLNLRGLPIFVLTYRAEDQAYFLKETLQYTGLNIAGYGFAESRKKDPATKVMLMEYIMDRYTVVEALDNDTDVLLQYKTLGVQVRHPSTIG